jgi:hypothetical protein
LRRQLEWDGAKTDLGQNPVPDTNLLACLAKDFLRELPEPVIPPPVYAMLIEAVSLILPTDKEGNQKLVIRIVDCLPKPNRVRPKYSDHTKTALPIVEHIDSADGSSEEPSRFESDNPCANK